MGREYLEMYKNKAKLVVTTKLHCAIPCLGMGIPVILTLENIDYRFSWVEKLLPIYTEWNTIDWSAPHYNTVETAKKLLLDIYRLRINSLLGKKGIEREQEEKIKEIDAFYSDRERKDYNSGKRDIIARILSEIPQKNPKILIWGAGRTGNLLYEILKNHFPYVEIIGFVDTYKRGEFKNLPILKPEQIKKETIDYIFLCSLPGQVDAKNKMMMELGLALGKDYQEIYFENPCFSGMY